MNKHLCLLPLLAFVACESNDEPETPTVPEPTYVTVSFEDCTFAENSHDNFAASGSSASYTEFDAEFSNTNTYYMCGGVVVADQSEASDWEDEYAGVPSDRKVICNHASSEEGYFTGADSTAKYSVWAYTTYSPAVLPQLTFPAGVEKKIVSAKVNNVAKYWQLMKIGYYSKPGFEEGDYYEVHFVGYDSLAVVTDTVDVVLGDFRDGKTFIQEDWTEVDLSPLGNVNKVVLTATHSDKLNNLLYGDSYAICVDEIKFEVPAEEAAE